MKTAIIMGRFQPITNAHYGIIQKAIEKYPQTFVVIINSKVSIAANVRRRARVDGSDLPKEGDIEAWKGMKAKGKLSKSANPKRMEDEIQINPFSGALRAKLIYDAFNGKLHNNMIIQSPLANIEQIINRIIDQTGSKEFVILCGEDRRQVYTDQIKSAIEKEYVPSDTKIDIEVLSRDMDSADNVSATRVRQALKDNDREEFNKLVPNGIQQHFYRMRKFIMTEGQRSFFRRMLLEMTHIEDLKVSDFISFVKEIYSSEASIKLDGTANLAIGIDDSGKLYTAFGKNAFFKGDITPVDKRVYSVDDWIGKNKLYFNSAASAHSALEKVKEDIKSVLKPGQEASAELMFGDKPNCIKYDFGGVNYLVILNNEELADILNKKVVHTDVVNLEIDVEELKKVNVKQTWTFGKTQVIDPKKYDININQELQELEAFLEAETEGFRNIDIIGMKAIGKKSEMIQLVRNKALKLKLNIKEQLLKQFVRKVKEGSYIPSDGYSHEGIVLKNKSGEMTKIIDKDVFTAIHEKDWKPSHDADKVIKSFEKNGITKEEAITYLTDRITNFDKYYSDVADDMKDRMKNALKMMRIDLKRG